jgi:uncharacterized protein YaaQ
MKSMFDVIRDSNAVALVQALVENHYRVNRMARTGGFLQHGNITLMSGIEADHVQAVIGLLHQTCCPSENSQHRATFFVVDMPYFEQI